MKTEQQIRNGLADHTLNMNVVLNSEVLLKKIAKNLKWTEDRVRGYMEGVQWAYKWVLEEKSCYKWVLEEKS